MNNMNNSLKIEVMCEKCLFNLYSKVVIIK